MYMLSRMRKAKQLLLLQQGANRTSRPDRGDRPHGSYGFSRLNGPYRSNGPNWSLGNGADRSDRTNWTYWDDRSHRPNGPNWSLGNGAYGLDRTNWTYWDDRSHGSNWSNGAHRIRCGFSRMRLYTTDAQYSAANHPALSNG